MAKLTSQNTFVARDNLVATVAKIRGNEALAFPVASENVAKLAKYVSVAPGTNIITERGVAHNTHVYLRSFHDFPALATQAEVEFYFF